MEHKVTQSKSDGDAPISERSSRASVESGSEHEGVRRASESRFSPALNSIRQWKKERAMKRKNSSLVFLSENGVSHEAEKESVEAPRVVLKEGWLKKHGQIRYFVLTREVRSVTLSWFHVHGKDSEKKKHSGKVENLEEYKILYFGPGGSNAVDFKLDPPPKSGRKAYILQATTNAEMMEWIKVINRAKKRVTSKTMLESAISSTFAGKAMSDFVLLLPKASPIRTPQPEEMAPIFKRFGPKEGTDEDLENWNNVSARVVSTYPLKQTTDSKPIRDGDPIADHFSIQVCSTSIVACVADGCGWGRRPSMASVDGCTKFVSFMSANLSRLKTVRDVGNQLLEALDVCHSCIVSEAKKRNDDTPGTTTLIGGVLLQKAGEADEWVFVFVSLGDCKAFLWKREEDLVVDLTSEKARVSTNATDPGGRIGSLPEPDVRNLYLSYADASPGDILLLVSDGIHDNIDPVTNGLSPADVRESLSGDWKDLDGALVNQLTNEWRCRQMKRIIGEQGGWTPSLVTEKLISHCISMTQPSRDFMEDAANSTKRLPSNYKLFPGKMDHATCLSILIPTEDRMT